MGKTARSPTPRHISAVAALCQNDVLLCALRRRGNETRSNNNCSILHRTCRRDHLLLCAEQRRCLDAVCVCARLQADSNSRTRLRASKDTSGKHIALLSRIVCGNGSIIVAMERRRTASISHDNRSHDASCRDRRVCLSKECGAGIHRNRPAVGAELHVEKTFWTCTLPNDPASKCPCARFGRVVHCGRHNAKVFAQEETDMRPRRGVHASHNPACRWVLCGVVRCGVDAACHHAVFNHCHRRRRQVQNTDESPCKTPTVHLCSAVDVLDIQPRGLTRARRESTDIHPTERARGVEGQVAHGRISQRVKKASLLACDVEVAHSVSVPVEEAVIRVVLGSAARGSAERLVHGERLVGKVEVAVELDVEREVAVPCRFVHLPEVAHVVD